jgi:hypothetical protein
MIPHRHLDRSRLIIFALLALPLAACGIGCGLPKQWHLLADKMPQASAKDPAYQMLCIWEPAEGVDPKGLPTRGFAGKITFFTRHQQTGVRVHGNVEVSVFDDQGPVEKRGQPIHNWVFEGDAWAIHLQDSSIGPSYSVFIPYSRTGNHQAQCALQVKFTSENGGAPLYSDTVAVLLPGPARKKEEQPLSADQSNKRKSLDSITIPLMEKRTADDSHAEFGKVERNHTVAPVSELYPRQTETLGTLPRPPRDVNPHVLPPEPFDQEATAKPLRSEKNPGRASFTQVPTAPPEPPHALLGKADDEAVGSNP